jgi:vacuolar-type H+-ATPase subunit I/STV1
MEECTKYGGPTELARQLSLNKNLEERNKELQVVNDNLTRTRDSILQRIEYFEGQEAGALKRRDDLLEEAKSIDREVRSRRSELENVTSTLRQRLNAKNEWEAIQQRMEEELARLNHAIVSCKKILAPAYWIRSILEENRPVLFQIEKEYVINFLTTKQPESNYSHEIGHEIIDYLIDELTRRRTLIPKQLYDVVEAEARRWADKTREIGQALHMFVYAPERMTDEQRTALLVGLAAAGLDSKDKFDKLQKQASGLGAQCPIHHLKMGWSPARLKWLCPTLNCKFVI